MGGTTEYSGVSCVPTGGITSGGGLLPWTGVSSFSAGSGSGGSNQSSTIIGCGVSKTTGHVMGNGSWLVLGLGCVVGTRGTGVIVGVTVAPLLGGAMFSLQQQQQGLQQQGSQHSPMFHFMRSGYSFGPNVMKLLKVCLAASSTKKFRR